MNSGKRKRFTVTLAWQPMSTAPTDGTAIVGGGQLGGTWIVCNCFFDNHKGKWISCLFDYDWDGPTHWLCETNSPID